MSLSNFSKLFSDLDSNNSTNKKIEILINYLESNLPIENACTILLLLGKSNKRFISGKKLRTFFNEIYNLPIWLIEVCYSKVGDSAEVISLLSKEHIKNNDKNFRNISVNSLIKEILPELNKLEDEKKKLRLKYIWENIPSSNHLVFNKILTGTFRVGVSRGIITKSISKLVNIDESIISHRLMGELKPELEDYNFLINNALELEELNYKPYPFQLAKPFEQKIKSISIEKFYFESKWDGIRSQLIKRSGKVSIWTRGEELVNNSFPDLLVEVLKIEDDFVLDGEILVWNYLENIPKDFSSLQKRLGRKKPSSKIQNNYPITFITYDILELNGNDIRQLILEKRRLLLKEYFSKWQEKNKDKFSKKLKITPLHDLKSWEQIDKFKNLARINNTEGLVIKKKSASYLPGRKSGHWWKYKVDPMQLDAVLIYAKSGSGKRAGLYTDYSFALWDKDKLVKFASAYSGLSNNEIKELDNWIRKNTIEKYGPVRSVKPEMVFEISFEKIQLSNRHKAGIAVRFPRISKWRKDKLIKDANKIKDAYKLMNNIS
tara:strand:+ start:28204 stop:29844 length:1641 start_codon:yes stop_codon:yes gene_type:complete